MKTCNACGHLFDLHELAGYDDPQLGVPIEGWMVCPVAGCRCEATWSVGADMLERLRAQPGDPLQPDRS